MAVNSLRCGKRRRMVRKTCVPSSSTIMGQPQRHELSVAKNSLTLSIFYAFVFLYFMRLLYLCILQNGLICCKSHCKMFNKTMQR